MSDAAFAARAKWLRLIRVLGSFVLPAAVLTAIWVIVRTSPASLSTVHLNLPLVLLSFAVECSGLLIAIPIWHKILAAFGVRQRLADDVRIYCYSALGLILPGGIWSIVSRSTLYQRIGANGLRVATASVVETLLIGVAAVLLYVIVGLFQPGLVLFRQPVVAYLLAAGSLILVYPGVFNRLSRWAIRRLGRGTELVAVNFGMGELWTWIASEVIVTFIGGLAVYVLIKSLGDVTNSLVLPVLAAWAAASAASNLLFWVPGTPLIRDGAMVAALTLVMPLPIAIIFVGLQRIWTIMSLLLLAAIVWLVLDRSIGTLSLC